jgi:MATE family multidrug resistance protein
MTTQQTTKPGPASCRELLGLAWPFILSNSCWTLQIVLDRILLSRSSTEAVGAGMSAVMMFWSLLALFQWTANYATTFVAQYTGAGQPHKVGAVVGQAMWFAVASGLAFLLLVPLAGPIVGLSGHTDELQALEVVYFRCLCYSALPFLVVAAAGSFFAGRGDSATVLWINVAGLFVNGCCASVLIFGYLGFEPMGIAGAGWATVAGTSTSALVGVGLMCQERFVRDYAIGRAWRFDGALMRRLLFYGMPQGVGMMLETMAFSAFLIFVGRLGAADLAATSIACTLNLIAFLPMMGVGQAVEVLVGQELGANDPARAERAVWSGLVVALGGTLAVALAYVFVPTLLVLPFQTHGDPVGWAGVEERVPLLLRFVAVYCLFDCFNMTFAFALRGAGDTRFVTVATALLSWSVMVLPSYLAWRNGLGLYWSWGFASLYLILLSMIFLRRFLRGAWKEMRIIGPAHGGESAAGANRSCPATLSDAINRE